MLCLEDVFCWRMLLAEVVFAWRLLWTGRFWTEVAFD